MIQHHRRRQDCAEWISDILSGDRWSRAVYRLEHRRLPRMNVPAGRHSQSALDACSKIGDDVAEHIIRDNNVELPRVAHHLHAQGVHIHMFGRDLRILARHVFERSLPQTSGVGHGIGLIAHENFFPWRAIELGMPFAILEGITDDSLNSLACIDVFLHRDLVGCPPLEYTAHIAVHAFCVLANHHEVDVFGFNSFQRAQCCVEQANGTDVGVEIHLETHAQENLFGMDVGLDARIAEGSHQDGIEVTAEHGEPAGRNCNSVFQIAVGSPIELA